MLSEVILCYPVEAIAKINLQLTLPLMLLLIIIYIIIQMLIFLVVIDYAAVSIH